MFDINILISLNQSINEWTDSLKKYIERLDYFGLYILGDLWNSKGIENINTIEPSIKYEEFIKYIDNIEIIVETLNNITKNVIQKEVLDYAISKLGASFRNEYDKLIKLVFDKQIQTEYYLKNVTDVDFANENLDKVIKIYENSFPHGNISTSIYVDILKKNKKIDLLEPYKSFALGLTESDFRDENNDEIHPIQKINYLIKPFENSKDFKKAINISLCDQTIDYNIFPLISKIYAIKFGDINFVTSGLNKIMINRFKTITVKKNISDSFDSLKNIINKPLNVYTGSSYKHIIPVNFKEGYNWKPLNGVHPKVYKYNTILENMIFKNMKIDNSIYKSFKIKDTRPIVETDVLKGSKNISEICFNELDSFLSKRKVENINIIRELYLIQFFNALKVIEGIRKRDEDNIEIIPLTKLLAILKLI